MKCRAVCGIRILKTRRSEVEDVFRSDPFDFEANGEQSAKTQSTRWANGLPEIQDITGAALLEEQGELPGYWDEESRSKDKAEWEAWGDVKKEPYEKDPNSIYAECQRHSRTDYVYLDSLAYSSSVYAYIRLAWLEDA